MGSLRKFNVEGIRALHRCTTFVETGTAQGDSLEHAATAKFAKLHSIEIEAELVAAARNRFGADSRIEIWHGSSESVLPMLLRDLPREPVFWWLDAHFPGAHTGAPYDAEKNARVRLPLAVEIETIAKLRDPSRDVFLIDDARIYLDGPFRAGPLPADWPPLIGVERSIDFIRDALGKTHNTVVDYEDQGYIMTFPRAAAVVSSPKRRAA